MVVLAFQVDRTPRPPNLLGCVIFSTEQMSTCGSSNFSNKVLSHTMNGITCAFKDPIGLYEPYYKRCPHLV